MTTALILFAVMYVLLLTLPQHRWKIALSAALLFVVLGILPIGKVAETVNWNVILMIAGTMAVVELFIESKMPALMAEKLMKLVPDVRWAVVALSLFAGLISAFVDNVATVLMVAPLGLAVSKQIRTDPVPVLISIAVSSNLQGAATLVGDTTSILLGSYANMSFNDFFWFHGRPGLFFVVEAGALLTVPVLLYLFRKETGKIQSDQKTEVRDYIPTALLAGVILSLIAASQFENKPELTNGMICMAFAVLGTAAAMIREKSTDPLMRVLKSVDYETLLLLTGLFIVIGGITEAGVIDAVAGLFVKIGGGSKLLMYVLIVAVSVAVSAFVDNIPYVATMLPVVRGIAAAMGVEPYLFYFGLLIGATLGGNITPVGASANITAIGILQKEGHTVSTKDFLRIGIPFTLTAVLSGSILVWLLYA